MKEQQSVIFQRPDYSPIYPQYPKSRSWASNSPLETAAPCNRWVLLSLTEGNLPALSNIASLFSSGSHLSARHGWHRCPFCQSLLLFLSRPWHCSPTEQLQLEKSSTLLWKSPISIAFSTRSTAYASSSLCITWGFCLFAKILSSVHLHWCYCMLSSSIIPSTGWSPGDLTRAHFQQVTVLLPQLWSQGGAPSTLCSLGPVWLHPPSKVCPEVGLSQMHLVPSTSHTRETGHMLCTWL